MTEFNNTLQALSAALQKERAECLIATATRPKPLHREESIEIAGLSAENIKDLVKLREWQSEIIDYTDKLKQQTDGNPLMIECICEDQDLWARFKDGKLDLARHVDPAAFLLKEMWDSLTAEAKDALKTIALLSKYLAEWKFRWGREECKGLIGASWDDIFSELKGKCFVKEKEPDVYEMHELISGFALNRLEDKRETVERVGDYFSSIGKEEIAMRFHVEAMNEPR